MLMCLMLLFVSSCNFCSGCCLCLCWTCLMQKKVTRNRTSKVDPTKRESCDGHRAYRVWPRSPLPNSSATTRSDQSSPTAATQSPLRAPWKPLFGVVWCVRTLIELGSDGVCCRKFDQHMRMGRNVLAQARTVR